MLSSSSLSSGFARAGAKEVALSGLISVTEGEERLPLSIILADGSIGEMDTEGEKSLGGDGRWWGGGGEVEILLQDLEEKGGRWDDSCLARFNKFLGFSTDCIEGEILNLLLRTKRRREQNIKKEILGSTKFDRELKKLELGPLIIMVRRRRNLWSELARLELRFLDEDKDTIMEC